MTPEQFEQMNQSRTADLLMNNLKPYMDKQRGDILERIKAMYRSGDFSESKFLSCAAALCVLDDLENQMKQTYRKGQNISKEQYDADARRN